MSSWKKTMNLRFEGGKLYQERVRACLNVPAYPAPHDKYSVKEVDWMEFLNQKPPEINSNIIVDGEYGYVLDLVVSKKLTNPPIPCFAIVFDRHEPPVIHEWFEVSGFEQ